MRLCRVLNKPIKTKRLARCSSAISKASLSVICGIAEVFNQDPTISQTPIRGEPPILKSQQELPMEDNDPSNEECCCAHGLFWPDPTHFLGHGLVLAAT